jgi:hypothetical protein
MYGHATAEALGPHLSFLLSAERQVQARVLMERWSGSRAEFSRSSRRIIEETLLPTESVTEKNAEYCGEWVSAEGIEPLTYGLRVGQPDSAFQVLGR